MIYAFADCVLDTDRRELRRGGRLQPLEPQALDLLAFLVSHRGRVATRDEIFRAVWADRFVSDAALSTRLHEVRRAIGDAGSAPRMIRTVYGIGAAFTATVVETRAAPEPAADPLGDRPCLMVLPFAPPHARARHAMVVEAFHEELVAAVSRIGWISVVSGPHPALGYLVDGSLRQAHGRLRVIARLIVAASGRTVWAQRFAGSLRDAFELQKRVAARLAEALGVQLYSMEALRVGALAGAPLGTWEAVVRALSLLNLRGKAQVASARAVLARALHADPASSAAASLLSFATTLGVHMGWERRETNLPGALRIASAAVLRNPDDAWAHLALGYATMYRDPDDAIPHLERASLLDPGLSIAHYLLALSFVYAGQTQPAFHHADLAERLSPFDLLARGNTGVCNNVRSTACFAAGRFEEGAEFARRSMGENPMLIPAHRGSVINLALAGKVHEAREALRRLRRLAPALSHDMMEQTTAMAWAREADHRAYHEAFSIAGLD